jgi:hypothetical protein
MTTKEQIKVDASKAFQFIGVKDCGECCCPHCGADGRYIYSWAEFGNIRSAMAGCYAALTGHIKMDDVNAFMQRLSIKVAKSKPLNGWDKTVIRMQQYIQDNGSDESKIAWANGKIREAISSAKAYQFKKFR